MYLWSSACSAGDDSQLNDLSFSRLSTARHQTMTHEVDQCRYPVNLRAGHDVALQLIDLSLAMSHTAEPFPSAIRGLITSVAT